MQKKEKNNMAKGKLALGALIGAVAGFVSGVLLAPKSGKETRDEITKDALKVKATAEKDVAEAAKKVKAEATKLKAEATKTADEVYGKAKVVAKDVTTKAKEIKGHFEEAAEDTKKTLAAKPKTTTKKK